MLDKMLDQQGECTEGNYDKIPMYAVVDISKKSIDSLEEESK